MAALADLADFTTFKLGGGCEDLVIAQSEQELIAAVAQADQKREPLLIIGGGSNLLIGDAGFAGRVVVVATKGNSYEIDACSGGMLQVAAGENWDELVAFTLSKKLANLESLSGIPGTVGAAPIQNVGAYGHEVGETIARLRTYDRREQRVQTLFASDAAFSYRSSKFKEEPNRYVILDVTFQLRRGTQSLPIAYPELANELGVSIGDRADVWLVRDAVLALRQRKGMLAGQQASAGSFFTNPIVSAEFAQTLPLAAPRYLQSDGGVKLSAAWLIQESGTAKGEWLGGAQVSPLHVLALTNAGSASTNDVLELAKLIRDRVWQQFKVELKPEVNLINAQL
jgi:UDP-N-acetylmuramate dehydrogenase